MIQLENVNKSFHSGQNNVDAMQNVNLTIQDGDIYGIIGFSGAGKSTLVRCINLLETPDTGKITVNDQVIFDSASGTAPLSDRALRGIRGSIGMIYQHFNLFDRSTVFENVAYPLRYHGHKRKEIQNRVFELLRLVDLEDKVNAYPSQLSGGQKQRVAIARALANNPKVLLCDEATSALDPDATESILELLKGLNEKLGLTIVLITHEMAVIKSICHNVAVMEYGEIVENGNVYDVFSNPQKDITKRFITSSSPLGKIDTLLRTSSPLLHTADKELLVKLTFEKNCVGDAVISEVSRRFNVNVNIVLANVDLIQNASLGEMVAILHGSNEDIQKTMQYFAEVKVKSEVITHG